MIKKKLQLARKQYHQAAKLLLQGKMKWGNFNKIRRNKIALEREYSLAKGWETAIKIKWDPSWNTGASLPYVMASETKIFLIYLIKEDDPNWDGTYVNVIDDKGGKIYPLALVEFKKSYINKFGGMNNEVWHGHSLFKRGLEGYAAHEIKNSKWLQEQKKINSVHSGYKEARWAKLKHYMFLFHDTVFECLAEDFEVKVYRDSFENVVRLAVRKLFEK